MTAKQQLNICCYCNLIHTHKNMATILYLPTYIKSADQTSHLEIEGKQILTKSHPNSDKRCPNSHSMYTFLCKLIP